MLKTRLVLTSFIFVTIFCCDGTHSSNIKSYLRFNDEIAVDVTILWKYSMLYKYNDENRKILKRKENFFLPDGVQKKQYNLKRCKQLLPVKNDWPLFRDSIQSIID